MIPELSALERWIVWRLEIRDGKPDKVPYQPRDPRFGASSTNSSHWVISEEAEAIRQEHSLDGVGIVLGEVEPGRWLVGIDVDHCRDPETGDVTPGAAEILGKFDDTYQEVSPSGDGVHILGWATYVQEGHPTKRIFRRYSLEAYSGKRYLTFSGRNLNDHGLADITAGFLEVVDLIGRDDEEELSDDEVVELVREERLDLWTGDLEKYNGDHNCADLALVEFLARHCGRDSERVDRLFRLSGLCRDKWENREDYRERTIAKVLRNLRPTVRIVAGKLPEMIQEAEGALMGDADGAPVFQRGTLVHLVRSKKTEVRGGIKRYAGNLAARTISKHYMVMRLTQAARWERYDARAKGWVRKDCPDRVAETLMACDEWRLPVLGAIVEAPTMRPDGTVLQAPGYDAETDIYLDASERFEPVPESPTREEAAAALEELKVPLEEFPYVTESDRSTALAAVLTVLSRPAYPRAPLFAFSAPAAGSGKGLQVDVAAILATGRCAPAMNQGRDSDEQKKRIFSILMEAAPVALIDNVERPLGGDAICSALTQECYKDRILGKSGTAEVPTGGTTWFTTGNNLTIVGDLKRRVVPCDIDPRMEHPERRRFERDLHEYVRRERGRLVRSGLTVLRGFVVAGRPDANLEPFGSFEGWSELVRGALVWLGEADPCAGQSRLEENDPETACLRQFLTSWWEAFGSEDRTAAQVAAEEKMREPLSDIPRSRPGIPDSRCLGKYLRKYMGRICGGMRIERRGEISGTALWRVTNGSGIGIQYKKENF